MGLSKNKGQVPQNSGILLDQGALQNRSRPEQGMEESAIFHDR
jgi:hypothetical protein